MHCKILVAMVLLGVSHSAAYAKDIIVKMKNTGAEGAMVFEPSYVNASIGDRIIFKPTDPGHNVESIPAMLPKGAQPLKGAFNKEVSFTASVPGLYGLKCAPHYSMGMIALVQVGKADAADIAQIKAVKLPPLAGKRMSVALAKVK